MFCDLLGFYPPPDMDAVRVRGHSGRRPAGSIEDGQLVLYVPVRGPDDVIDGRRYVLTVSEGDTSRLLVKRVQMPLGGGLRVFADNASAGVPDQLLVPDGEGGLVNHETGQPVHVQFVGRVVWPDETISDQVRSVVSSTLDAFVQRGYFATSPPLDPPR